MLYCHEDFFLRNCIFCSCSGCHKRSQWHCHVFICVSSISQRVHEFKNKFRDATVPCLSCFMSRQRFIGEKLYVDDLRVE